MKILCLTNLFPDTTRPEFAPFNRQQIMHLADLNEVRVIAPVPWTHMLSKRLAGDRPAPLEEFSKIDVSYPVYYYTPKIMRDSYWRFYRSSVASTFGRHVREFNPDLVYATWAYPDCRAAVELSSSAGLPLVMRIHGSDINDFFRFRGRKRLILEAVERADAVISVNEVLKELLVSNGADPSRIHVIYNGIDRSVFLPQDRDNCRSGLGLGVETPVILFAGNLKPVKGVDLLLEAFSRIEKRGLQLHILGDGPLRSSLEKRASSLGISGKVFFHGSVAHREMSRWYSASDILCLPSLNEGTPNVILEALACGIPVVASDTGGIPEVVNQDAGILFRTGDIPSLTTALSDGLERSWERSMIDCPAGSWVINAKTVTDLFESVCTSRSS